MPLFDYFQSLNCASNKSSVKKPKKLKKNASNISTISGPSAPPNLVDNISNSSSIEDDLSSKGKSFYDIGRYKVALKRCDNGAKLGNDLSDLISERAKLEDNYGKSLKNWRNKWDQHLNSVSNEEYGLTTKEAWFAFLEAGSKTADIHIELSKNIINNPVTNIKEWLKTNYKKHFINFQKTKEFEENFIEAQKNWSNLYNKMKKCEKDFKEAIEDTSNCEKTVKSAESNPKYTSEQRYKLGDKLIKLKNDKDKARDKYKESIIELDLYKPRYIEHMKEVFNKTQHFEQERMLFFKQTFLKCHELLQIQQDERFDNLFIDLDKKLNEINPHVDLEWWALNYGTGTKENWPKFIDFEAEN